MSQPPTEPVAESHELGSRARSVAVVAWSAFLAAALATMLCFAFIDPLALSAGEVPEWWTSRLHVYAVGFFFFWLIGFVAAALCRQLTQGVRRDG
jgi:fructose-specific phosphotransferase system IIC component